MWVSDALRVRTMGILLAILYQDKREYHNELLGTVQIYNCRSYAVRPNATRIAESRFALKVSVADRRYIWTSSKPRASHSFHFVPPHSPLRYPKTYTEKLSYHYAHWLHPRGTVRV